MASDRDALAALIAEHFPEYVSGHCLCGIEAPNLTSWSTHVAEVMATAGMRSPAQVITERAELDKLPPRAVVIDGCEDEILSRTREGSWVEFGSDITCTSAGVWLPATVLYLPTENGESQ